MGKLFLLAGLCLLCCLISPASLRGQDIYITGRVTDIQTGEGIPFANLFVRGRLGKFTTDFDGYFRLQIKSGALLLGAICIGYKSLVFRIPVQPSSIVMNFALTRAEYKLKRGIVKSEAAATNMVRLVVQRKSAGDKNKLNSYSYEAYTRMEVDLDELSPRFENRKIFRPFKFVFNDIDSLSEARPFLPFFLSETVSDFYYLKHHFLSREIIKGSKVSGISDVNISQFLGSTYVQTEIYSDYIILLKRDFLSPVSQPGISSYNYFLVDSQVIDHFKCYKIRFIPRSDKELRLEGEMWVADSIWAIKQISMRSTGGSDINLIHTISVYNEFAPVHDSIWMLKREKIAVHFAKPSPKTPELVARKLATYKNFILNEKQRVLDSIFKTDNPDIVVRDSATRRSNAYWMPYWQSTPYFQEQKVYYMLDTLKNMRLMKNYINLMQTVFFGYVDAGPVSIGNIYSFIGENNIEGWRFKFGMRTSNSLNRHFRIGAYIAYGLQDKKIKYGSDLLWVIKRDPRTHLSASFRSDLTSTSNYNIFFFNPDLVTTYGLRRIEQGTYIPYKIDAIRELKVDIYHEFKFGYSFDAGFTNRYLNPLDGFNFSYQTGPGDNPANATITNATVTEFSLVQRIAWQERFISGDFRRISLGSKYPVAYLQYSVGVRGIIQSQFNYQRLAGGFNDTRLLGPLGKLTWNVEAGRIFGTLPYLFLQIADASETYIESWTGFNTIEKYQFAADRYVKVIVEHHLEGLLFDQIPGLKKAKLREVYGLRMWWGDMTGTNLAANYANLAANANNAGNVRVQVASKTPFFEMNAGIENILTFFRIDAVWRLTYLDPRGTRFSFRYGNFGIRLGFNLQF